MRRTSSLQYERWRARIAVVSAVCDAVQISKWRIRTAKASESSALSECIDAAYSIYASRVIGLPAVSEGISNDIENHRVWVAVIDQDIVGGIILIPHDESLLLANIAVHPESSGLGLGRALTGHLATVISPSQLDTNLPPGT